MKKRTFLNIFFILVLCFSSCLYLDVKAGLEIPDYEYAKDEYMDSYGKNTQILVDKTIKLSQELNEYTNKVIEEKKVEKEDKEYYDNLIKEFEAYKESLGNDYVYTYSYVYDQDAKEEPISNYTAITIGNNYKDFLLTSTQIDKLRKYGIGRIDFYDTIYGYSKAYRRYAINVLLYSNNWRYLPNYITSSPISKDVERDKFTFTDTNQEIDIDGMIITKEKKEETDVYNVNLKNVKEYEIISASNETYGYPVSKIVTQNGNIYVTIGFLENINNRYNTLKGEIDIDEFGYMVPCDTGTAIGINGIIIKYDTSEVNKTFYGESYSISDIFDNYLNSGKMEYKDITISKEKENYIIEIKNLDNSNGYLFIDDDMSYDELENINVKLPYKFLCARSRNNNIKYFFAFEDYDSDGEYISFPKYDLSNKNEVKLEYKNKNFILRTND